MSDKDVDAQFADIVAHWDDVAVLPEDRAKGYAASAPAEEAATTPSVGRGDDPPADLPLSETGPGPADEASAATSPSPRPAVNPPPDPDFLVWRGATPRRDSQDDVSPSAELDDEDDEDDHFHPGPTAPLPPQEDLHFWGIVVGLVAGPLLLLWLVIFHPAVSGWWTLAALGLSVGGFVLLVMRQPDNRDGDDPDDGARI